jgi:hypothetical protein
MPSLDRHGAAYLTDSASARSARPHGLCSHAASRVLQGEEWIGALVVRFRGVGCQRCLGGELGEREEGMRT